MKKRTNSENGYALLAMLAGLTIALVILAAAAAKPSIRFESQRENEEEMMYRAVQVANAIYLYASLKGGGGGAVTPQSLPIKLEDVAAEMNINGKKIHLVRASAMVDPLTNDEWKPVRLGDPMVRTFLRTYMQEMTKKQAEAMASGPTAAAAAAASSQNQQIPPLLMLAAQAGGIDLNKKSEDDEDDDRPTTASGFSLGGDDDSRPIIGVISKSKKQLIRNYYGADTYDKALFVSGIQPLTMSYIMPPVFGTGSGTPSDQTTTPGTGTTPGLIKVPCSVNPNQRGC